MNAILKSALASRKKMVDETSSTSAMGTGQGSITDEKPTTHKLQFYTGDMIDKSETGLTGLLNQGATCYLNSLLQSLFMTPELRRAVFEWKYDCTRDAEPQRCIPLQIQKLFAKLQTSVKGAVHTRALTTSFGWTGREVYTQHDVLELSTVLFENIEIQALDTSLARVVSDLHRGAYEDYVQCLQCKARRGRTVPFVGLGLDLSNADIHSFDSALRRYTTPETLNGGNRVTCDQCQSKQDSKKGIRLTTLPYFLGIHLKRWTFSFATLQRIKITKKISFPLRFDASVYLNCDGDGTKMETETQSEEAKQDTPLEYELYSMMIHTGGAMGGHYFAYIKDFKTQKWLRFNDSNVKEIPATEIEKWFNPPLPSDTEQKEQTPKDTTENKSDATKPAPIPLKPATNTGLDIGAAISANLKDKRAKKDVSKKLKEAREKRPDFLHPFAGAYMLMYRLVDPERNVIEVSPDLIPPNIADEIKKEDLVYAKQKSEFDHLRQFTTLKIHFEGTVSAVMVKKKESLAMAVDKVYCEMKLSESYGVESVRCMRLRNMKVLQNVPLEPYGSERLSDLIETFGFHDPKHLILETKKSDEEFAKYEKEKISLRIIELDEAKMEWKSEVLVQVNEDSKIGALRQAICDCKKECDGNAERIRMAYLKEGLALLLSDDSKRIKKDERILNGHYIHFEVCPLGQTHTQGKSALMAKFDKELNSLHLLYNDLDFDQTKENIFTNAITVDVRTQIGQLRQLLADALKIEVSELVLRKGFHSQELKNNSKTLEQYRLHTNCQVFAERGTPLLPTQYLFQIFVEDQVYIGRKKEREKQKWDAYLRKELAKEQKSEEQKSEKKSEDSPLGQAFLFVGDCVLDEHWAMDRVKQEICGVIGSAKLSMTAAQMRVRSFNDHNRLVRVYLDSLTLRQNLKRSIKDFTQICCQRTATENERFDESKILLYIARWYPQRMDFGETVEYALPKKTKIKSELRQILSDISGIPLAHIRCEHPRAYLLKKMENRRQICILNWENTECGAHTTLVSKQWKCKNGEFILFKDERERERLTKADFETGSITSIIPRAERPLVFYSPQQQIQREIEQKKAETQKEMDLKQAQSDAIERMKHTSDLAAKAALKSIEKSELDK